MNGIWLALVLASTSSPSPQPARFALVMGNNRNLDRNGIHLAYADDDAALYAEQLSPYFQRIELLSLFDDDTQRRFPHWVPLATLPTRFALQGALKSLYHAIQQAREQGKKTELLFVFVGHGGVDDNGHGYLHLADGPFRRADLFEEVIAASPADTTHIVVDACHAYSLVAGRSERNATLRRRHLEAFLAGHDLEAYPKVGVLVATSQERETHEWSHWRAGVFSHQVRSALTGAADVNLDGRLEYSEVAAFVAAANAGLADHMKGMRVFAWPPASNRRAALVNLRHGRGTRYVLLSEQMVGRMHLESRIGVRWADLHKASNTAMVLSLPSDQVFFLRDQQREIRIDAATRSQRIEATLAKSYILTGRGATEETFLRGLFSVPLDRMFYQGFLSGKQHFIPVADVGQPMVQRLARTRNSAWMGELAVGYQLGQFPLRRDKVEHTVFARLAPRVASWARFTLDFEFGYTDLQGTQSRQSRRYAALAGMAWSYAVNDFLVLETSAALGYGHLEVRSPPRRQDPSVAVAQALGGVAIRVWDPVWFKILGGGALHIVTNAQREEARGRGSLRTALSWRP